MRISVTRHAHFNAAHRLHNKQWSDDKNIETFGLCNSPNYHGHNYEMDVTVTGELNPVTGYLIDLKDLKDIIKENIEDRYDHKNLNLDTQDFIDINPTTENLCIKIYEILKSKLDPSFDLHIKLWETPRNSVSFPPLQ